jgi:hypothetical protein
MLSTVTLHHTAELLIVESTHMISRIYRKPCCSPNSNLEHLTAIWTDNSFKKPRKAKPEVLSDDFGLQRHIIWQRNLSPIDRQTAKPWKLYKHYEI